MGAAAEGFPRYRAATDVAQTVGIAVINTQVMDRVDLAQIAHDAALKAILKDRKTAAEIVTAVCRRLECPGVAHDILATLADTRPPAHREHVEDAGA